MIMMIAKIYECSLCARPCAKHFTGIISFNSHSKLWGWGSNDPRSSDEEPKARIMWKTYPGNHSSKVTKLSYDKEGRTDDWRKKGTLWCLKKLSIPQIHVQMIFNKSNVMEKGQAFQQMMLVQLDIHRQNVKFNLNLMSHIKITSKFAIPGGLVVRTWHFHCHGLDSVPDQGTKVLQDLQCGPKFSFKFNLKKLPQNR